MALTDAGKAFVMNNDMKTADMWVGLSSDGSGEQGSAAGYARRSVPDANGNRTVSNAGVLALHADVLPLTMYTPNASGAPDSSHMALFDAATSGNRLTDWTVLSPNVAAPVLGQPLRLTALTVTP